MQITVNLGVRPEADFGETLDLAEGAGLVLLESDKDWRYARGTVERSDLEKLYRIPGLAVEADRPVTAI